MFEPMKFHWIEKKNVNQIASICWHKDVGSIGKHFRYWPPELKHYENTSIQYNGTFYGCKNEKFHMKKCYLFVIFGRNRDCGYPLEPPHRGGSNGYPQSMFYSRNKKNNVLPCKPHFFYIKWGLWGSKLHRHVLVTGSIFLK